MEIRDLPVAAVARPGDAVFLQPPEALSEAAWAKLVDQARRFTAQTGIHVLILDKLEVATIKPAADRG